MEEDAWGGPVAQGMVVAEAGTCKQLEDPLLQEVEAQTKDNPIGEGELCNLEVQACKLGKYVEDRQM